MYCLTCHNEAIKQAENNIPPCEFIIDIFEIENHMQHMFESLKMYRDGKLQVLVRDNLTKASDLQQNLAIIGLYVKSLHDGVTHQISKIKELMQKSDDT